MDPGQGRPRSEANAPDTATDVQETGGASPLTALLFDVCGVFYDDTGWRRWLFRLVTKMGIDTHYEAFFALFDQDYLSGSVERDTDYWEALRSYLGDIGLARGTIDEVLAAGRPRRGSGRSMHRCRLRAGPRDSTGLRGSPGRGSTLLRQRPARWGRTIPPPAASRRAPRRQANNHHVVRGLDSLPASPAYPRLTNSA